jgi:hypothetical protein
VPVPHSPEIFNTNLLAGSPDFNATSFLPTSDCAQSYVVHMPHANKTTIARYWAQNNAAALFYGNVSLNSEFTWFGMKCWRKWNSDCQCEGPYNVGGNFVLAQRTVNAPAFTSNFDDVPGSTLAGHRELHTYSTYSWYNSDPSLFTGSNYRDESLHRMVSTVSGLDLHDPANPGNNFVSPVGLDLMYVGPGDPENKLSFGFPYINHPTDRYDITPFDAVYAIGDNVGVHTDNTPKPTNQFHVEDPLSSIGYYLANVEVAPEILYLSNRNLATWQDDYEAEFEARTKIYVGNGIYGLDGNENFLTKDGDFNIDGHSTCVLHAPDIIAFTAGTNVSLGAELHAYIENYNCPNVLRNMVTVNSGNENDNNITEMQDGKENKSESKKEEDAKLKVYPNPGNGTFIVENQNEELNSKVIISDLTGKIIYNGILNNNERNEIDLQNIENGIYVLKVINKNNFMHSKICINK